MTTQLYEGKIPRTEIPWYPTVDEDACIGCGDCAENCPAGVYETPVTDVAKVIAPYNCVVGCSSCAKTCPADAINFMSKEELVKLLNELREKYK